MSKNLSSPPPVWMVAYTTNNPPIAYIVAGRLQSEGIQAMVHEVPGANAIGIRTGSLGEVTVLVRTEDYTEALAILEADEVEALPDSTDDIRYLGVEDDDADAE